MVKFDYALLHFIQPFKPEWGSLDILEACGVSYLGSNPSSGVCSFKNGSITDFIEEQKKYAFVNFLKHAYISINAY